MDRKHFFQNQPAAAVGIAACAISVTAANEIQLLPAGQFRATDGRPHDVPHWQIDAERAARIIDEFLTRKNRTVVDYEHQTLLTAQNGQPAPAAAWFSQIEWRDSGLYAIDVEWTARASQMIESGEYRYISPVFTYDKQTGAVKRLLNAALTNNPALDGMDAVAASQINLLYPDKESLTMNELLEQLRWLLNLPVTATTEEVVAELQKAIDQLKASAPAVASRADFHLVALVNGLNAQITTLRAVADNPDPARFVPVAAMQALQGELASLKAEQSERTVNEVVESALAEGRLLPVQENWARDLGKKDLASLTAYLEASQPIAALSGNQTGGKPPAGGGEGEPLTDEQLTLCRVMNISPEDFRKNLRPSD
ncbi:phage protease [Nitrosomonas halophila]|uniref:Mu-like prophage I protein n=1 Tax=Nitrosomonas halophila TaxID=44576 RepID=A0A1H3FBZ1_9PROT|nr:phage protease [Nitrosomonas halophila]SDX88506.1 Mu-like prophage I protein [Nitrosomonas halophila]